MRFCVVLLVACNGGGDPRPGPEGAPDVPQPEAPTAEVVEVTSTGSEGAYTVYVTIRSDETGCEQYADWWEILTPAGDLVYRRVLTHSHPDEQPFTRSGGPVALGSADEVLVRAHLHQIPDAAEGYGGQVMRGTFGGGFVAEEAEPGFAAELESAAPLPESCLF